MATKRAHYQAESFQATESIPFLTRRCASLMTAVGELMLAREGMPLSLTQWIVLMRLRGAAHLSASTLATDIGHDLGSLTRVVDELVTQGYVRRARSRVDRRGVELRITAAGRRLTSSLLPTIVGSLNGLLGVFTAKDIRQLHRLLGRLMQRLQQELEALTLPAAIPKVRRPPKSSRSLTP